MPRESFLPQEHIIVTLDLICLSVMPAQPHSSLPGRVETALWHSSHMSPQDIEGLLASKV